jgi:hypothetical protein
MLSFFEETKKYSINLSVGEKVKVKMFDQYKNLFFFEGVCVKKARKENTFSIDVYSKSRGTKITVMLNSPLIVGVFKKK